MSLWQLTERVHIYRGGVNFALLRSGPDRMVLVDSGLDSANARKALRPFLDEGLGLEAIINTHSHSDHIGGNADLVRRTGCSVWAPARERPFILWPELEPLALHGGAYPPPTLQVKFLQAQPTPEVLVLPDSPGYFEIGDLRLELVPLPGHAWDQVGIAVDGVLIAADGLFKPEVIAKHPIIFLVNVQQYLAGLERLAARPERYILPGHGELITRPEGEEDPLPAILQANRESLALVWEAILERLTEPTPLESLLQAVAARLGKEHDSDPSYFLDRAAVSAHLSYLTDLGHIGVEYQNGRRLIRRS